MKRAAFAVVLLASARAAADPPAPGCAFSGGLYAGASGWAGALRSRRMVVDVASGFVSTNVKLEGDAIERLEAGFEFRFCDGDASGVAARVGYELDRIVVGREQELDGLDAEVNVPIGDGTWRLGLRAAFPTTGASPSSGGRASIGGVRVRYSVLTIDAAVVHVGYGYSASDWGVFIGLGGDGVVLSRL